MWLAVISVLKSSLLGGFDARSKASLVWLSDIFSIDQSADRCRGSWNWNVVTFESKLLLNDDHARALPSKKGRHSAEAGAEVSIC